MTNLLKVLDMNEDFQWNFLVSHQGIQELCEHQLDAFCQKKFKRRILADLAFRLRDEWSKAGAFYSAMLDIQEYLKIEKYTSRRAMSYKFWAMQASPIHWIIAALIAKDKEGE